MSLFPILTCQDLIAEKLRKETHIIYFGGHTQTIAPIYKTNKIYISFSLIEMCTIFLFLLILKYILKLYCISNKSIHSIQPEYQEVTVSLTERVSFYLSMTIPSSDKCYNYKN